MPRNMVPLNGWFRWVRRWPRAVAASCVEIAALDFRARSLNFLRIIQNCFKELRRARIEEATCDG
jgi:hypothetical protein